MPINLSFKKAKSTGNFYSRIHTSIVKNYERHGLPPTSKEFSHWLSTYFVEDLSNYSAIEVGCGGHAYNAISCHKYGFGRVIALDNNKEAIEALNRESRDISIEVGSVLEMPCHSNAFDFVVCTGVVHHAPYPSKAFQEVFRVIKPGGTAYISMYAFHKSFFEWMVRLWRLFGKIVPFEVLHTLFFKVPSINNFLIDLAYVPILWIFMPDEVRDLLKRTGFHIVDEFPACIDRFVSMPGGRFVSGGGLLRNFICCKQEMSR